MTEPTLHVLAELSTYLDGRLSGSEKRRVESHLAACDDCRRHERDLRGLRDLIHETPSSVSNKPFYEGLGRLLIIVVAVIIATALVFRVLHRTHRPPLTPAMPVVHHPTPAPVIPPPRVVKPSLPTPSIQPTPPVTVPPADQSIPALQQLTNTAPSLSTITAPVENTNISTRPASVPENPHP